MAKKQGRVTGVFIDGWAKVIIQRGDACHNCEAAQFCHAISDCSKLETSVLNRAGAGVGDLVSVSLSSGSVFKGAFMLYLVPTMGLLCGAIVGTGLSTRLSLGETTAGLLFGLAGLLAGFSLTTLFSKRMAARRKHTPEITAIFERCRPIFSQPTPLKNKSGYPHGPSWH